MRIVATVPYTAALFRVDQLVAALAQRTLWLTDAYFAGTTPYVQALRAAARDGVDVRILVPGSSDIPVLRPLSRAGYRPLLEAGVRVFEWNGSMLHAKTAVADGRWARVGSTNLNLASWIGNRELDAMVEDEAFARDMEAMYLEDLGTRPRSCWTCAIGCAHPAHPLAAGLCRPVGWQRRASGRGSDAHREHRVCCGDKPARPRAGRRTHCVCRRRSSRGAGSGRDLLSSGGCVSARRHCRVAGCRASASRSDAAQGTEVAAEARKDS
jgi:hypothetical protein